MASPALLFELRIADSAALVALLCGAPLLKGPPSPSDSEITTVVRAIKAPRRTLVVFLLALAAVSAFLDGSVTVANAVFNHVFETTLPPWRGIEFYSVALLVAFAGFAIIGAFKEARGAPIWQSALLKLFVFVALAMDIALAVLIPFVVPIWSGDESAGLAPVVHFGLTVFRVLVLLVLFPALFFPRTLYEPVEQNGAAAQTAETSLLVPPAASAESSALAAPKAKYGTFNPAPSTPPSRAQTPAPSIGGPSSSSNDRPPRAELSWSEIGARLRRLFPYLWPHKSVGLQFLALICLLIVAAGRAINAAIPFKLSEVIDALSKKGARHNVWTPLFWYVGLKFLQGSGGLGALRDIIWAPVMQYSDRSMSQLVFDHLLNLSLAWHTRRKTGEVIRILDRGAAINHVFELIVFNVVPTLADIGIALYIFFWYFGPDLSFFIAVIMVSYVWTSIFLTSLRTRLRRQMNDADVATRGIHTDSLLNYETVKYFGGEEHEGERYREAISRYQSLEIRVMASLNIMNLCQNLLLSVGLLVGSLMVALDTAHPSEQIVKRFVVFITYLAQLYGPLNSLAYIYRSINQNLVDTERLMDLLDEPSEVQDKPDAKELVVTDGVIEFDNVTFSYDNRTTALNGVSFTIPKGGSLALVGESGSGKSTILRLLYRFYDLAPGNGAIRIDGQDIRDVTQASLRKAIGVVPQDSVLFNNTIGYNIGYGKFGASTEEIENAAAAAQMHERILSFPDGYETKVGERGVRLSGGEKQRVAIARALLKSPRIILLDEATSALDTNTERDIQKALQNLTHGRSSLSIAHRLSTVVNSDLILVLHQGEIVESGSHRELVERDGRFAAMWADQISSADETRTLPDTNKDDAGDVPGYAVDAPEPSGHDVHALPVPAVDTPDNLSFINTGAGPVGLGLGPQIVPTAQLVGATVQSEHPEPIKPEQQESERSLHEVRPDISFAAVAGGEPSKPHDAPTSDAPVSFPQSDSAPAPALSFPKGDDAASTAGSARPALQDETSGGVTFAAGTTEGERPEGAERFRQAAHRIRKISVGAAAKSGQGFAQLARRISLAPGRRNVSSPDAAAESGETSTPKADDAPAAEATPKASEEGAAPISFPSEPAVAATAVAPAADDASSLAGSARPGLREPASGTGTPNVTFAPNTEGERIKHAAQRIRKISVGAAAKSQQGFAHLARRMSLGPSRQGSISSGHGASSPGSPGFLHRNSSGSARPSMEATAGAGDEGSVAESDKKKKDKKEKRKGSD